MKTKCVRYIVEHRHKAYETAQEEDAWVSYSTASDGVAYNALSLAIHTASRYRGVIYSDAGDGERRLVKDYRPKNSNAVV